MIIPGVETPGLNPVAPPGHRTAQILFNFANVLPESNTTREMGTKWGTEKRSAVLAVPSVVIPSEPNFLLNPEHPVYTNLPKRIRRAAEGETAMTFKRR
jgi:hypothetical protein